MNRRIELLSEGFPERPALDTGVSSVILRQVASGTRGETLRIHRPGRTVAFARREAHSPGYRAAVRAARNKGFEATERLAGGRAAVFHPGTIAVGWAIPTGEPRTGIEERFEEISGIVAAVLEGLGVDAQIGEVPGEYCPGSHSVSDAGRVKLFGAGQRIVSHAVHVGGVLVVDGAEEVRSVLEPVYEALDFSWQPQTTGDVAGAARGYSYEDVRAALLAEFGIRYDLEESILDPATISEAEEVAERYLSPSSPATRLHESESGSISDM